MGTPATQMHAPPAALSAVEREVEQAACLVAKARDIQQTIIFLKAEAEALEREHRERMRRLNPSTAPTIP
jgi:hypothetical protein